MKKALKWIGIVVGALIALVVISGVILNKKKPTGKSGPEADALAKKVLTAINYPAWDTTRVLTWTFMGNHHYVWDKNRNYAQIKWGKNEVLLKLDQVAGDAFVDGVRVDDGKQKQKLISKAWSFWCNDSFWFNAPSKVFDEGTQRSIVDMDDGSKGLMITYSSGGVTPGDSYLYKLDENGLPVSWQMWVKILPIGGIGNTWEGWVTTKTGAKISSVHDSAVRMEIKNIQGVMTFEEAGLKGDPFIDLRP